MDARPISNSPAPPPPADPPTSPLPLARPAGYFHNGEERPSLLTLNLDQRLNFQYRGDVFSQHGTYGEASLYMSRLPSSRKGSILRPRAGAAYKMQVKLAPMNHHPHQAKPDKPPSKTNKSGRKRQYALAIEAMAANPLLHASLLGDNVIPSVLSLCRTKDSVTLASCMATLCHLSGEPQGREAILQHNALPILTTLSPPLAQDRRLLHNYLATLANLTIEDSFEAVFVKEKGLESLLKHRRSAELSEAIGTFAIFNLACPAYSYPRVDEVFRALNEHARDSADRDLLSQALYNFSCTRLNQIKLVENDSINIARLILKGQEAESTRLNALMTMFHLAENVHSRRAVTKVENLQVLIEQLHRCADNDAHLKCVLVTLVRLAHEASGKECLGKVDALDALVVLIQCLHALERGEASNPSIGVAYRLLALILSTPINVPRVSERVLNFLLAYDHHPHEPTAAPAVSEMSSRYVLYALSCIFAWSESDDERHHPGRKERSGSSDADHIEELLDDPRRLDRLFDHINAEWFAVDSIDVYFQMLLLYNLSFRYNRCDVARRASPRLRKVALDNSHPRILSLVCGVLFSLCQEYAVHPALQEAGVLDVLDHLERHCDDDTQAMCLEVVCLIFDGRKLSRQDIVHLVGRLAPVLVTLCSTGNANLRAGCAACFARFATLDESRRTLADHGVIESLALLANDDNPLTLRLCVHTYSYLSRDDVICAKLIQSGIIKSLTLLAAAPEEIVRRACAMTLCNLSSSEANIGALVKAGALKALLVISCVKSNDPETRRICMKAVMNLLRLPANIPQMCQDGLLWAFSLFANGMEPKDYDILCDAFCALAFYPATRKGIMKPGILAAMFQVLSCPPETSTYAQVKLLKGISNTLCDAPNAAQLMHAGLLPHLITLVTTASTSTGSPALAGAHSHDVGEIKSLSAEILVLICQSYPDAEVEFSQPEMLTVVVHLMQLEHDDCSRSCAMLLYQMSLHPKTRHKIVEEHAILSSLPRLFRRVLRETQSLLVRVIYNLSADADLVHLLPPTEVIECIALIATAKRMMTVAVDVLLLCAGLLRNLSCVPISHSLLIADTTTAILRLLFEIDSDIAKEDAAVCICNLFLGRINSNALLAQSVLPIVLWLCSHPAIANRALGTAVVRKLAIAPGNAQELVDGGVISHLALLLQDCATLYIKKNCIATFCFLSRRSGVPAVLASYGVIASVLELLEGDCAADPLFEAMCVDLLSSLAEFARADDPRESRVASILFQLVESDEPTMVHAVGGWQGDRGFLERGRDSVLAPPTPSTVHQHLQGKPSQLRHTLHPVRFAGFSADISQMTSHLERRTIEPIVPTIATLGEVSPLSSETGDHDKLPTIGATDASVATETSAMTSLAFGGFSSQVVPCRVEFGPLPMYSKLRTPFAALVAPSLSGSSPPRVNSPSSRGS